MIVIPLGFSRMHMESTNSALSPDGFSARYEIRELIGEGGMGKVFRASDSTLNRDVAIKILHFEGADEHAKERFLREARALASLNHPNIVRIFGSGLDGQGNPYHVMEFLEGSSLAKELAAGPLTSRRFFEVFSNVLSGLEHAHENKIVHRDLKPSNIIHSKDSDGNSIYKLIDFGIARIESVSEQAGRTLTATNTLLGSPTYMSPEQCRGERGDALSDIYSLGCVMYECVWGQPPFEAETAIETMYKHTNQMPAMPGGPAKSPKSQQLLSLIARCLEKKAAARPQTVAELAAEINKIFTSSADENIDLFSRKASKPNKQPLLIALTVCAGILGLSSLLLYLHHQDKERLDRDKAMLLSKPDRVARDIEMIKARPRKDLDDLFTLGRNQLKSSSKKDIEDAVETYSKALSRCDPNGKNAKRRVTCFALRAKAKWMLGKLEAAGDDFDEAIRLADSEVLKDIFLERSLLQIRSNRYSEARSDFVKATADGFENYVQLSFPEKLSSADTAFTQRLDKLGASRVHLIYQTAEELRQAKPQSDAEIVEVVKFANRLATILHWVAANGAEDEITTRPTLEYANDLISKVKGYPELKDETAKALAGAR